MKIICTLLAGLCLSSGVCLADASLKEARQRLLSGNYDEALEMYTDLGREAANQPQASIGQSLSLQSQGEYERALSILDETLKNHANSAPLQATRADLLYRRGLWMEAEKAAQAALAIDKENLLARWITSLLARDCGDIKKAAEQWRWFVRTYTDRDQADKPIKDPDELLLVGLAGAEHARQINDAEQFTFILNEIYADAIKIDPRFWPAEYQAGLLLLEKYNRGEALDALDKALKINPRSAEALSARGTAALMRFELKEAEQFAERALKINPNLPEALRLRADIHLAVGDPAKALKELALARKVNDRDEKTLARVAACLMMQQKKPEADKLIEEVLKFDPRPEVYYFELGERLEERRLFGEAEKSFQKAMEFRPGLAGPANSLGMLYLRLGKEKEATPLLQKGFKADPFNVRVSNSIKVLKHLEKYETLRTKHYELRYDPKNDPGLAQYMGEALEKIHEQLVERFNYKLDGPILIELFNNHEMFSGRTIALPDLHTIGACTGRMIAMVSPNGRGVRKPFNWSRVLRHEMVHIFNLEQTNYLVPHWFTEGLAVSNEGFPRPPSWNQLLLEKVASNELLNLDTIDLAFIRPRSPLEWQQAYLQSLLYVQYLTRTHGDAVIGKLLTAFRDGLNVSSAIEKACAVDKAALEKGYKEFLQEQARELKGKPVEKKKTLAQLKQEHEKDQANADITAAYADAMFARDRVEARKLAELALSQKKNHPRACMVLAKLAHLAGDLKQEKEFLVQGLDRQNPDLRLLQTLGKLYYDAGSYPAAGELFELGRKQEPQEPLWLEQLARVYAQTGDRAKHIAVLKELVPTDADDLERRKRLTKLLLEEKDFVEAEKYARQGMEIDVTDREVRESLDRSLRGQKKDGEADRLIKIFEQKVAGAK